MRQHEVLIIGGGLAGMRAAQEAQRLGADVAMISKIFPTRSHSAAAQGGINASVGIGDSWEVHAYDTVKGSDYLGDQDAIEVLCEEGPADIIALERMGVTFNRDEDGRIDMRAFGGATNTRTCYVADQTGQVLLHVMWEQLLKSGLTVYSEWFVTDLLIEDGRVAGCVAMEIPTGRIEVFRSKAIVLCTGGIGQVYYPTTNGLVVTGDGLALAYRAGASLMDMEMVQHHPTTLKANGVLITEGARGEGAYLLNSKGERFMENYAPNMKELASRDVVSRAETMEVRAGRAVDDDCVLLDLRHLGRDLILTKLTQIYELARDYANCNVLEQPLPIRPGHHYMMGGIVTDLDFGGLDDVVAVDLARGDHRVAVVVQPVAELRRRGEHGDLGVVALGAREEAVPVVVVLGDRDVEVAVRVEAVAELAGLRVYGGQEVVAVARAHAPGVGVGVELRVRHRRVAVVVEAVAALRSRRRPMAVRVVAVAITAPVAVEVGVLLLKLAVAVVVDPVAGLERLGIGAVVVVVAVAIAGSEPVPVDVQLPRRHDAVAVVVEAVADLRGPGEGGGLVIVAVLAGGRSVPVGVLSGVDTDAVQRHVHAGDRVDGVDPEDEDADEVSGHDGLERERQLQGAASVLGSASVRRNGPSAGSMCAAKCAGPGESSVTQVDAWPAESTGISPKSTEEAERSMSTGSPQPTRAMIRVVAGKSVADRSTG